MKKIILFITVFLFQIAQAYWSMHPYKNELSAYCLKCSFIKGIIIESAILTVLIAIIYFFSIKIAFLNKHKNKLLSLFVLIAFYLQNYNIFERHATWSTYSMEFAITPEQEERHRVWNLHMELTEKWEAYYKDKFKDMSTNISDDIDF